MIITRAVASFIKLYLLLLFVRVLLSWFPTFQWWEQQPFAALRQVGRRAAEWLLRMACAWVDSCAGMAPGSTARRGRMQSGAFLGTFQVGHCSTGATVPDNPSLPAQFT